jgi:hypothetical protein
LTDEGFEPARIQTTNNVDLTITLVNSGTRPHAFVVDDFDIAVELAPGGDRRDHVTPTAMTRPRTTSTAIRRATSACRERSSSTSKSKPWARATEQFSLNGERSKVVLMPVPKRSPSTS